MPFDGSALTYVTDDGNVAFSNLTLSEYLAAKEETGKTIVVLTPQIYAKWHEQFWSAPFKEISEKDYDYALNVLPPLKWHDLNPNLNIFFCLEATSGSIHACYIYNRQSGKYYAGSKSILSKDDDLIRCFSVDIVRNEHLNLSKYSNGRYAVIVKTVSLNEDVFTYGVQYWTKEMIQQKQSKNTDHSISSFIENL